MIWYYYTKNKKSGIVKWEVTLWRSHNFLFLIKRWYKHGIVKLVRWLFIPSFSLEKNLGCESGCRYAIHMNGFGISLEKKWDEIQRIINDLTDEEMERLGGRFHPNNELINNSE